MSPNKLPIKIIFPIFKDSPMVGRKKKRILGSPRRQMPHNTLITDKATKTKELGGAGGGGVFFGGVGPHVFLFPGHN